MIKANELRCGNMVLYKPYGNRDGERVTIAGILGMKAYFNKYTNESGMLHNLQPIPLTEEWLMKLGFTKYVRAADYIEADENHPLDFAALEDWTIYEIEKLQFFVGVRGSMFSVVQEGACYDESTGIHKIGVYIKYVHQLQNLFHALRGEELTLKEIA